MQAVTSAGQAFLKGRGGLITPVVELWAKDSGGVWRRTATLHPTAVSTNSDATAAVPRSCSITLPGFAALIPDTGTLPPASTYADTDGTYGDGPYGDLGHRFIRGLVIPGVTELRLWDRLHLPTGTTEDVAAGRYRVDTVAFRHSAGGIEATITGLDVADRIAAAGYTQPYLIGRGTHVGNALSALLTSVAPGVTVTQPGPSSYTTPRLAFLPVSGANPWEDARRLAYSAGWELTTDRTGGVVAFAPEDPGSGTPDWTLTEARLVSVATSLDDHSAVNAVVVEGQTAEDAPVRGVAELYTGQWGIDTIGRRTHYESREHVNTVSQANLYAASVLRRTAGLIDQVELETPFLPHLDAWDLVRVDDDLLELDLTTYRVVRAEHDRARLTTRLTLARRVA